MWYVESDYENFCVRGSNERFARKIFELCKTYHFKATLFKGIELVEHYEGL